MFGLKLLTLLMEIGEGVIAVTGYTLMHTHGYMQAREKQMLLLT